MLARKPGVLREVALHEVQGGAQVGVDEFLLHLIAQRACNGPHKKGHGLRGDGKEHQLHHQPVHQRAFGVVHPEAALAVLGRAGLGHQVRQIGRSAAGKAFRQVFDDGARFRDHVVPVGDDGRFAQRVHGLE